MKSKLCNITDLSALYQVGFSHTRRKATGWLGGTAGVYTALEATCQNDHVHELWGIHWAAGTWVFDTSAEAAYPALLAQRAVECMLKVVTQRKLSLHALPRLHDLATAAQGKQSGRHLQLIPEFHCFSKQLASEPQQPGTKLLAPHLGVIVGRSFRQRQMDGSQTLRAGENL